MMVPVEPDIQKTVQEFQRRPVRVGCLGCTVTGWIAVAILIGGAVLTVVLIRRLLF